MKSAICNLQRRLLWARHASLAPHSRVYIGGRSVTIVAASTSTSTSISGCTKFSSQPYQQLAFEYFSTSCHPTKMQQPAYAADGLPESESEDEEGEVWEDEAQGVEPRIGDGGDGGGIVLRDDVPWGQPALFIAQEILLSEDDLSLFSFKTSPWGYIYIRLDKLSDKYGCPRMDEIENFSQIYKTRLDEAGEQGEIPDDLALEVSSPGAERLLKIPDDLERFKELPVRVRYTSEEYGTVDSVFLLDSVDTRSANCVWKLANVKENRAGNKGRPFTRKQKGLEIALAIPTNKQSQLVPRVLSI